MVPEDMQTDDDKEAAVKLAQLDQQAHLGALFEDWMRHQAGQLFAHYLDEQINDSKNRFLSADDKEALNIRVQAQVYQKIKSWVASQIATGKLASVEVKKFVEEGAKLEGWVKDQSSKVRPE